jgi:hypothetical protein
MCHEMKRSLSVEDESVWMVRNRLWNARARIETALQFVMWPEVREELRHALVEVARALDCIGR